MDSIKWGLIVPVHKSFLKKKKEEEKHIKNYMPLTFHNKEENFIPSPVLVISQNFAIYNFLNIINGVFIMLNVENPPIQLIFKINYST